MIWILGDVHGFFYHVIEHVQLAAKRGSPPDAIIFLGDLDCSQALHQVLSEIRDLTDIWFIHGNHDTDDKWRWNYLAKSELADKNLHGRVVEIAGLRVAGLGGVFRPKTIWAPDKPDGVVHKNYDSFVRSLKKKPTQQDSEAVETAEEIRHKSSIFPDTVITLARQRADILLCHEAPSCHPYGWKAIDDLSRSMRVQRVFHGHHHDCRDYSARNAQRGFEVYGVGFCGITALSASDVVQVRPGDFDDVVEGSGGQG
jgi:predicted phosphodiesterase